MTLQELKKILSQGNYNLPVKKYNGKWGVSGSTALDRTTEYEAYNAFYNYLKTNNLI